MEKDTKIFVAGARGLVGSALVQELRKQGYNNLLTPTSSEVNLEDPVATRWFFSVSQIDHVFFCAAYVGGIAANVAQKVKFLEKNLHIELNVIANAAAYDCKKLLFVSTSCCYPRNCPQPMHPRDLWSGPLEPTTEAYSVAKLAAMKLCQYYSEQHGKNFISVMPCNIFGPRDNFNPETAHALPGMMARMHAAKLANDPIFEVWGSGSQKREFIFSEDLARGLIVAMNSYDGIEPINIGSGWEMTMSELAHWLAETVGYTGGFSYNQKRPTGTLRKLFDSSVINSLGWRANVNPQWAMLETYDWFKLNCCG